mmetsp:Transcript_16407/g.46985  ORF Transcript_16407/g.46985 Transcript_16407/m.46985 type:complete len:274 (+) Transcript_16407:1402-2223(+)
MTAYGSIPLAPLTFQCGAVNPRAFTTPSLNTCSGIGYCIAEMSISRSRPHTQWMKIRFGMTKFDVITPVMARLSAEAIEGISTNCPMPVSSQEIFGGDTIVICMPPKMGNESIRGHKMMKTSPFKFNFRMPMVAEGGTWIEILALQFQSTPMPISTPWCTPSTPSPTLSTCTGPRLGGFVPREKSSKHIPLRKPGTAAFKLASTSSFMIFLTASSTKGQMTATPKFSHATSHPFGRTFTEPAGAQSSASSVVVRFDAFDDMLCDCLPGDWSSS